jgi:4-alpha-glucanotransferase
VISAPKRAWQVGEGAPSRSLRDRLARLGADPAAREWGVFLPLYALRREEGDLGVGDLSGLEELGRWVGEQGGSTVATLPLLAAFLGDGSPGERGERGPFEPSPYAPASRLFWNELWVDPRRLPELELSAEARRLLDSPAFAAEAARLAAGRHVDYRGAYALRRRVLAALAEAFFTNAPAARRAELDDLLARRPELADYAAFRALVEARGECWHAWPEPLRSGEIPAGAVDESARRVHLYAQLAAEGQLAEVGRALAASDPGRRGRGGLYLDLPLGVHPDSYDAWRHRELFAAAVSAGAPPDDFFTLGQDWGFHPIHPERSREEGHAHWIAVVRHHLAHAGWLRIDHVMQLHRLWWVPRGLAATDGAYVRYPADELTAVLTLESHRARARIVGENLGTVPAYVDRALERHGIAKMFVLPFEIDRRPATRRRPGSTGRPAPTRWRASAPTTCRPSAPGGPPPTSRIASTSACSTPPAPPRRSDAAPPNGRCGGAGSPARATSPRPPPAPPPTPPAPPTRPTPPTLPTLPTLPTTHSRCSPPPSPRSAPATPRWSSSTSRTCGGRASRRTRRAPRASGRTGAAAPPSRWSRCAATPGPETLARLDRERRRGGAPAAVEPPLEASPEGPAERSPPPTAAAGTMLAREVGGETRTARLTPPRRTPPRRTPPRRTPPPETTTPEGSAMSERTTTLDPTDVADIEKVAAGESLLTDDDLHLFNEGRHFQLYDKLGAHRRRLRGQDGYAFAVWAPNAEAVSVIGDFNGWDADAHPLAARGSSGIWEGFIPGAEAGMAYKLHVRSRFGGYRWTRRTPSRCAARCRRRPARSSGTSTTSGATRSGWRAAASAGARRAGVDLRAPLGSWRRKPEDGNRPLTYREMAEPLADHCAELGFTHVELLPVMEHPFYGSWGYQTTGYFAPTSALRHAAGPDVPDRPPAPAGHRRDPRLGAVALPDRRARPRLLRRHRTYSSTPTRARASTRTGAATSSTTGATRCAASWSQRPLLARPLPRRRPAGRRRRLDALSRLLAKSGEWIPNVHGGRENLEAIDFLRQMNAARSTSTTRTSRPSPRSPPPGRWCRGRPTSAASASATSGTWAGCTTR